MILIRDIPLPLDGGIPQLKRKAAGILGISPGDISQFTVVKQSVDARKKQDVHYVMSVELAAQGEEKLVRRAGEKARLVHRTPYCFPPVTRRFSHPPVVVGMGPAGLFAALFLARAGVPCIILERGRCVEERTRDIHTFWSGGVLQPESNVQFGEGGAGTFSDGKLNTGTHDSRIREVLRTFAAFGAPEEITWQAKPHIGTDNLREVIRALRRELITLGCDIRFQHRLCGLTMRNGRITGAEVSTPQGNYSLPCDTLVLAPGHSARDTFQMLCSAGVPMEPKPFAIGVRIEHQQARISQAQYGPAWEMLPAAGYKLACHLPDGRGVFSFCVCPGGQVVAAASEHGGVVTNGMSCFARDGSNCNGGLLVGVTPGDFGGRELLAGVEFQRRWEQAAFALAGGNYCAPAQTVGDFLKGVPSSRLGSVSPTYRPGVTPSDLRKCLPPFVTRSLSAALPLLDRRLHGFADPGALLTGVETRSSSPVRILRGGDFQSCIRGLYPCGEGAGYAGGITSAAVDGIKVAEAIAAAGNEKSAPCGT